MSYTPGPWTLSKGAGKWTLSGKDDAVIGEINRWSAEGVTWQEEAETNARLISASPLLLEALQECYAIIGRGPLTKETSSAYYKARAAIEAATGGGK